MNQPKHNHLLSKDQSLYIKGIAIILMFVHHLFTFPNRYPQGAEIISLFGNLNIEILAGSLGKYCVPVFLFMSGYGFAVSNKSEPRYFLKKIFDVQKSVWLVFIIYIPLDLFFNVARIKLEIKPFLLNFFSLSASYNGEWWFILPYIIMVAITPLLQANKKHLLSLFVISLMLHNMPANDLWGHTLFWQTSYLLGFLLGSIKFNTIKFNIYTKLGLIVISGFTIWETFKLWGMESMVFAVPLTVYISYILYEISPNLIRKVVIEIGKNCMFMWLTHSFYCYHFAGKLIYSPKYSLFILLNLLIISYLSARLLNYIYIYWNKLFITIFSKLPDIIR